MTVANTQHSLLIDTRAFGIQTLTIINEMKHTKFPIDYMHQVCLGVMKKLLLLWIQGKRDVRISAGQVNEISNRLFGLKPFVSNVFARRPRGLDEIDRWEATEFRQFLLYSGILALDEILRGDLYNHFLCLSVTISILVCPSLA